MAEFLRHYFLQTGFAWAVAGGMASVMLSGLGSARGIRIAGAQAGGGMVEQHPVILTGGGIPIEATARTFQ